MLRSIIHLIPLAIGAPALLVLARWSRARAVRLGDDARQPEER